MPRKTSQAVKKDTAVDSKNEGGAPRRSGRATTKQETSSGKEATRSRRSSTAAQTAASVADSKTPKGRTSVGSRRDSTSPSDSRGKSNREGIESPATRVKSTRRNAGRVNYKESDGEEEGTTPKYDENFDSSEEFEESDSDEKSKTKGRNKPAKAVTKSRGAKDKGKGSRSRRGRPTKKKSNDDEDSEAFEVSDDSVEPETAPSNKKSKATPVKEKETTKGARSRKLKPEVKTEITVSKSKPVSEEKSKPARRSARAVSNKEESPKKRPSRSLQTKRYTEEEEEDEDIEEASESKNDVKKAEEEAEEEEYVKPIEGSRKRKRGSTSEPNKRVKETVENELEEIEEPEEEVENADEKEDISESKSEVKKDKTEEDNSEEPMEVDESDSVIISKTEIKSTDVKSDEKDLKSEDVSVTEENHGDKDKDHSTLFSSTKEKLNASNKQESIDSSENLDESMHSSDSEQGSRAEQSISSGLEDSQDSKENKKEGSTAPEKSLGVTNEKQEVDIASQSSESFQQLDDNSEESKGLQSTAVCSEQKEETKDKIEGSIDFKSRGSGESYKNDNTAASQESKSSISDITPATASFQVGSLVPPVVAHSNEQILDASLNGSEKSSISNPAPVIHSTSNVIFEHPEDSAPKANGAHDDLHSNSVSSNDQYYSVPGRKYIVNTKLTENVRQSVQDKTFGFVSYNLGSSGGDACLQKDKLLNELNNLNAHIICIQQVSKGFYGSVLEPSLDALGFKGTFTQPEESLKGMATFYKTSFFRLSGRSEASLKHLIEKELEASPLDPSDRIAVRAYVKRCGHVLFTHFASIIGTHAVTVANVQVPPADISIHALQVSCLIREAVRINGGTNRPILLGGEFNMAETAAPYQLLMDGYLNKDMIDELQRRKDVALPGKENAALINLLWKSFKHPSSNLCSCYTSVLDREVFIPEQKITSPDLLWYSTDNLYTVGVLDIVSDKPGDHHFSLKADIAFSV